MMREIRQALALNSFFAVQSTKKNDAQIRGRRTTNRLQPRQGLPHPRAQNHFQIPRDLFGKPLYCRQILTPVRGILQNLRHQLTQRAALGHLCPPFGKTS